MFFEIFSPYKHVLAVYLGNKKPTFLACNTVQVHTTILGSSKINDFLQNRQIYSRRIFETSQNFLDMGSESPQNCWVKVKCTWVQSEDKDEDSNLLALASNLRKLGKL